MEYDDVMFLKWPVDHNGLGVKSSKIIYIGLKNSMTNPDGKHTIASIDSDTGEYNENIAGNNLIAWS